MDPLLASPFPGCLPAQAYLLVYVLPSCHVLWPMVLHPPLPYDYHCFHSPVAQPCVPQWYSLSYGY